MKVFLMLMILLLSVVIFIYHNGVNESVINHFTPSSYQKVATSSRRSATAASEPKSNRVVGILDIKIVPEDSDEITAIIEQLAKSEDERATLMEVKKSKISPSIYYLYSLEPMSADERTRLLNLARSASGYRDDGYGSVTRWSLYLQESFGLNLTGEINIELNFNPDHGSVTSALVGSDFHSNEKIRYSDTLAFASSAFEGKRWRFSHLLKFELPEQAK